MHNWILVRVYKCDADRMNTGWEICGKQEGWVKIHPPSTVCVKRSGLLKINIQLLVRCSWRRATAQCGLKTGRSERYSRKELSAFVGENKLRAPCEEWGAGTMWRWERYPAVSLWCLRVGHGVTGRHTPLLCFPVSAVVALCHRQSHTVSRCHSLATRQGAFSYKAPLSGTA